MSKMNKTGSSNGGEETDELSQSCDPFGLKESVKRAVQEFDFEGPTPFQVTATYVLKDCMSMLMHGVPEAGERLGRTTAIVFGILHCVDESSDSLQAILLSPTLQAAEHMLKTLQKMGKYTKVRLHLCNNSLSAEEETRLMAEGKPHVIVGTPGRVEELLAGGVFGVDNVHSFVLHKSYDEAWKAVEEETEALLHRLPPFSFSGRRSLMVDGTPSTCVCFPLIKDRLPVPFVVLARSPSREYEMFMFLKNPFDSSLSATKEQGSSPDPTKMSIPELFQFASRLPASANAGKPKSGKDK